MNITKQIVIAIVVAVSPLFLFSQEKDPHFKFEQLSEDKNVDAKFLENYNKGRDHYNQAVSIIKKGDYDVSPDELNTITKKAIEELKIALPYFENAYKINPKDENTLMGLCGIYFGLEDTEKSNKFRKELEAVRKK